MSRDRLLAAGSIAWIVMVALSPRSWRNWSDLTWGVWLLCVGAGVLVAAWSLIGLVAAVRQRDQEGPRYRRLPQAPTPPFESPSPLSSRPS